jgi:Predicted transcriptional regulator
MNLGPLEERVMEKIWEANDKTTVREIWESMDEYAYTTILTIFQKLERKGFIEGWLEGKVKVFKPKISREEYYKMKLERVISEVFMKNPNAIYSFFVENVNLKEEDVERLLKILKEKL